MNAILAFEPTSYRRIVAVLIEGKGPDPEVYDNREHFSVEITDLHLTSKIEIKSLQDSSATQLANDASRALLECRPKWSDLATQSPTDRIAFSFLLPINLIAFALNWLGFIPFKLNWPALIGANVLVLALTATYVTPWAQRVFPRVSLLIGRQAEEWQETEQQRQVFSNPVFWINVISSIVASLVIGAFQFLASLFP